MQLPPWKAARDVLLFLMGSAGVASEAIQAAEPEGAADPTLLFLYASMIGLPFVVRKDESDQ